MSKLIRKKPKLCKDINLPKSDQKTFEKMFSFTPNKVN